MLKLKSFSGILYKSVFLVTLISTSLTVSASDTGETGVTLAPELKAKLDTALADKGLDYKPRTEHLNGDGSPIYLNRLILEDSPYLIQHAHNPVNWYPWGEEAFEAAKRQDKPIFLSIGYATCHWCHVMERESFENETIAEIINNDFIAIKVDREQRPDVDATFMTAVQLLTRGGGWPMSSFLTPASDPFFGGTYFPPAQFTELLERVVGAWEQDRERLVEQSKQISAAVAEQSNIRGEAIEVGERDIARAVDSFLQRQDYRNGGFGHAPKFPQEPALALLLEQAQRTGNGMALGAAHFALQKMAMGGIYDHAAGGFHRYAVDAEWQVPHFEKMLYNQANLSRLYLKAFLITGDKDHARTLRHTLDYVLREMTTKDGGFYSATDADSEGEEGSFFVWTPEQIIEVLGELEGARANMVWDVSAEGNFEGKNILHLSEPVEALADQLGVPGDALRADIAQWRSKLLDARNQRERPIRDDKVITAWNGMMISAMAEAGDSLNDQRYLDAAIRSANFLWSVNQHNDGLLYRTFFDGNSSIEAGLSDYAYFAEGMLALFDATSDQIWLQRSQQITQTMVDSFWDVKNGAFYMGGEVVGGASLPSRPKDIHDSALPAGNAVALRVLTRLWHRTGEVKYEDRANALLAALSSQIGAQPAAFSATLMAAGELLWGESGARQYAARGKLRITSVLVDQNRLRVDIDIAPGWHVNAHKPLQDNLIATVLTGSEGEVLSNIAYPKPLVRTLGFQSAELALYEETATITATLPIIEGARTIAPLVLRVQACSDEVCLAPETIALNLSTASES